MALVFVGIGGFFGSCLRYLFTIAFRNLDIGIPFGTLLSNVVAGFLIGLIIGIDKQTSLIAPQMKLMLTTGFLGGLSTFSTFSLETIDLFSSAKYLLCILNVFLNLSMSFIGVIIGMSIAKSIYLK